MEVLKLWLFFSVAGIICGTTFNICKRRKAAADRKRRQQEKQQQQTRQQELKQKTAAEKEKAAAEKDAARRRRLQSAGCVAETDLIYNSSRLHDIETRLKQINADVWINQQTGQLVKNEKLLKEKDRLKKEKCRLEKRNEKDYFTIRERDLLCK